MGQQKQSRSGGDRETSSSGGGLSQALALLGVGWVAGSRGLEGRETEGSRTVSAMLKARCGAGTPGGGWGQGGAQKPGLWWQVSEKTARPPQGPQKQPGLWRSA